MVNIKIALVALNAKYTHVNLALRSLKSYCQESINFNAKAAVIDILEFTINNESRYILRKIYETKPDIIGFSCYIWNINQILALAPDLRKLLPGVLIIAGGPEVSFEHDISTELNVFDIIIPGEGEEAFLNLVSFLQKHNASSCINANQYFYDKLKQMPGIVCRHGRETADADAKPVDLAAIPFAYANELEKISQKTIYYEASRGCPFECAYCLSGTGTTVKFLSLDRVVADMDAFLKAEARLVKFVDRTFNCDREFAKAIWRYLICNDNGKTKFHFEISADLIDVESVEILKNARKGFFQFEIGIQTTNKNTLSLIKRKSKTDIIAENVYQINRLKSIRLHLDLIAGLPGEDFDSFKNSFNYVYALQPTHIQLGFLKLLKGSALRSNAEGLGIVYREAAPYEVLYTKDLCYDDMNRLRRVADMVELYYNPGHFGHTLKYMIKVYGDAMLFFLALGDFYEGYGTERQAYSKFKLYEILIDFYKLSFYNKDNIIFLDLLKFDMLLNENVGNNPEWFQSNLSRDEKLLIQEFYRNPENILKHCQALLGYEARQISRMCRIEKFSFDIPCFIESGYSTVNTQDTYILFNYYSNSVNFDGIKSGYKVITF